MDPLPNLSASGTEVEDTVRTNTETESSNQSPESSRSTRSIPQPTPILPSEELEHAYWAEYEEDTTVPDEDEMKEIDGGDSDYSASDRRCQPYKQDHGTSSIY